MDVRGLIGLRRRRCRPSERTRQRPRSGRLVPLPARRSTPTSPRSSTSACAWSPARWRPSSSFDDRGRRLRSRAVVRAGSGVRPGLLVLDGMIAVDVRVGDRTATELVGAGDLLQPATRAPTTLLEHSATVARARCPGASRCSTPASPSASARGRRSCSRSCAAPASARATSTSSARSPANRGWRSASRCCSGTSARAGARSSPAASASALPLTHRLLGQLVGAERPSVSHALASPRRRPGSSPAARDEWHLHGTRRAPPRVPGGARRPRRAATPAPAATRRPWPPGEADARPPSSRPGRPAASASSSTSCG